MADEQQAQPASAQEVPKRGGNKVDPAFFDAVNEYLQVTEAQTKKAGPKGPGLAILFAAARYNAHVFLAGVKPIEVAGERTAFLDYMTTMYRRMLNEHLDGMGEERGIDVGDSELAAEYAAAGVQIGRLKQQAPASQNVSAADAMQPAASNE